MATPIAMGRIDHDLKAGALMTTQTLEQIAGLLGRIGAPGTFAARRTATAEDLDLEVKGVGRIRFPISPTRAKALCKIARRARYGKGEETLLDREVRDTWEIPKSRVKIDKRRWNKTLLPMLERLRADLGLPEGSRLKADLNSMLVYAPGQFFLRHQDSEKSDEMIGTLVVTLPSSFKGGVMVIEHRGETVSYRATKKPLSFVAFYADCHHELRPVKEGYRIVLTYNLELQETGGPGPAATAAAPVTIDLLAGSLREHFETPLPPRWPDEKDAAPHQPPDRLVYLLDHEYTERGFVWARLKGDDAARAATLQAAAEQAGCDLVLALAQVHETWNCDDDGWDDHRYGRGRYWDDDEEESDEDDDLPLDGGDYELTALIESEITLERCIDPSGAKSEAFLTSIDETEVCATIPSKDLQPYDSEYEGYMGNWGNTMDRWYRRAAVVLWPRERTFAIRAEASPAWALEELNRQIRAGALVEARKQTTSLTPFWEAVAGQEERAGVFGKALRAAKGLEDPDLAAFLLRPFGLEILTPGQARAFVANVERYGEDWLMDLLRHWSGRQRRWQEVAEKRLSWIASMPPLSEALRAADDLTGTLALRRLLRNRWQWLEAMIVEGRGIHLPGLRDQELSSLAGPILGYLKSTAIAGSVDLRDEAVSFLCQTENDPMLPGLVRLLRNAAKTVAPPGWPALGLDTIRQHCIGLLEARLARPARDPKDWSLPLPDGCSCELCTQLGAFLEDPDEQVLEWPIAKERRRHVHGRIDTHELPVHHQTRRSGSPYTLVLTKTKALHEDEARQRRSWQSDLAWLSKTAGA